MQVSGRQPVLTEQLWQEVCHPNVCLLLLRTHTKAYTMIAATHEEAFNTEDAKGKQSSQLQMEKANLSMSLAVSQQHTPAHYPTRRNSPNFCTVCCCAWQPSAIAPQHTPRRPSTDGQASAGSQEHYRSAHYRSAHVCVCARVCVSAAQLTRV
eukprot:1145757-Pelagomonas_calceolata.AAC.11